MFQSPTLMRRLNGWLAVAWLVMIPLSIVTGWIRLVVFVAAISLYANVASHVAGWQAARVEVRQDDDADVQQVLDELRALREQLG